MAEGRGARFRPRTSQLEGFRQASRFGFLLFGGGGGGSGFRV